MLNILVKSSKVSLQILTLETPTHIMGPDTVFIAGGRLYMYTRIMKNKGPRIHPWGTP